MQSYACMFTIHVSSLVPRPVILKENWLQFKRAACFFVSALLICRASRSETRPLLLRICLAVASELDCGVPSCFSHVWDRQCEKRLWQFYNRTWGSSDPFHGLNFYYGKCPCPGGWWWIEGGRSLKILWRTPGIPGSMGIHSNNAAERNLWWQVMGVYSFASLIHFGVHFSDIPRKCHN